VRDRSQHILYGVDTLVDEEFSHLLFLLFLVWWQWRGNLSLGQCYFCISILRAHGVVMMVTVQLERQTAVRFSAVAEFLSAPPLWF
jgi:hypothetical protein